MKKVAIVLLMGLAITVSMNAQKVNDIKLEDVPARYVEVVSQQKGMRIFQVIVYLDYGQIGKMKDIQKGYIFSEDGTAMSFNGSMGVLNLMDAKGYKYISQSLVTIGGQSIYKYLLENTNYKKQ